MGHYWNNGDESVKLLAKEWAHGYRKFVCMICRKKPHLLEAVITAIGAEEGPVLSQMWTKDNARGDMLPSEEDIYEVHNLSKEWNAGQKKFVLSLCLKNPHLLSLVMENLDPEDAQDLLHMWMVDNMRLGANLRT